VLDRMLPKRDGLSMLAAMREDGDATPVLILSALGEVDHRVEGLRAGGDYHFDPQTNVIDVHISRLRSKIDKGFETPLLHTVRGAGYRLQT